MERIHTLLKLLLSFLKVEWLLDDYPLRYKDQGNAVPPDSRWSVQIINWPLVGLGNTREIAYRNLKEIFTKRKTLSEPLPRPGMKVPIQFASATRLERYPEIVDRLISEVLQFSPRDPVFISDESSLWDFNDGDSLQELHKRIRQVFGIDVTNIESGNVADIVERIARAS